MEKMNLPWFKRVGIIYIPQNLIGWLIMLSGIIYAVYRFMDIDGRSHSVSDTLRPFLINLFIIFIVYNLIAFLISLVSKNEKNLPDQ